MTAATPSTTSPATVPAFVFFFSWGNYQDESERQLVIAADTFEQALAFARPELPGEDVIGSIMHEAGEGGQQWWFFHGWENPRAGDNISVWATPLRPGILSNE